LFIATLVAAKALTEQAILGAWPGALEAVEPDRVFRLTADGDPRAARAALETLAADVFVRPADAPFPRLFVADMDSTMITVECIDELADYAGVKPQVAEITERAMQGELDFEAALKARVKLLAGLDAEVLRRCHDERVRIMPGARTLVRTLKSKGCRTVLVSGGFTAFADRVAAEIGFDAARSNLLGVSGGKLDGTVAEPILGAEAKLRTLEKAARGIDPRAIVAVGDGANDIPMIRAAGFGVAYHGKPAVVEAADAAVRYGDLTSILHGLGVPRGEWTDE
jgi:phosphoserine phosphatase